MKFDSNAVNEITAGIRKMGVDKADQVGIWTTEQMKQILKRQYEAAYPKTSVLELFPVTTELSAHARNFEYHLFDGVTSAKIVADYVDDLPPVDATMSVETGKVVRFGNAWFISIDEIKTGQALGSSLGDRKAALAREGHESLLHKLVFKGSKAHKIIGVFDNPNITKLASAGWKTDAEVASDELAAAIDTIEQVTNGSHKATNIVIPPSTRRLLAKRMPETTQSYLQWFESQNAGLTISSMSELEDIDGKGTRGVLVYEKNKLNMSIEIPEPFNMLPMQPKDLHFKVPCTSKATGLIVYRPLTMLIITGV